MQIELTLNLIWLILTKLFCYVALPYYIYTRVIDMFLCHRHYTTQAYKVSPMSNPFPILGNGITIIRHLRNMIKTNSSKIPLLTFIEEIWGGKSYAGCMLYFMAHMPRIIICDPKVVEAIYTTRNSAFTKNDYLQSFLINLIGNSVLFEETNENWRQRRKAMTPAFYKEKLRGLVTLASQAVKKSIKNLKVDQERTIEIMDEI